MSVLKKRWMFGISEYNLGNSKDTTPLDINLLPQMMSLNAIYYFKFDNDKDASPVLGEMIISNIREMLKHDIKLEQDNNNFFK